MLWLLWLMFGHSACKRLPAVTPRLELHTGLSRIESLMSSRFLLQDVRNNGWHNYPAKRPQIQAPIILPRTLPTRRRDLVLCHPFNQDSLRPTTFRSASCICQQHLEYLDRHRDHRGGGAFGHYSDEAVGSEYKSGR